MKKYFCPIDKILEKPYSYILGYPNATARQIIHRYNELSSHGIENISFFGNVKIKNLNILGKGHCGLILLAKKKQKEVVIKIRRIDSQKKEMINESSLLKIVNNIGIGPKVIGYSKNMIVMEYLSGTTIIQWIQNTKNRKIIKKIIKRILTDCYMLDKNGIDHGELNNITKHVIIKTKPTLVDFENASINRKVSNVTSATQSIYLSSKISKEINKKFIISKITLIKLLQEYKHKMTYENFRKIIIYLELD